MRGFGFAIGIVAVMLSAVAQAAPLRPFEPVDICGEIVSSQWQQARKLAGQPGFSGSPGHERTFPARFGVVLRGHRGVAPESARWLNGVLGGAAGVHEAKPGELILLINSADPHLLDEARSLCVDDFSVRGDEGGAWVSHGRVVVKR